MHNNRLSLTTALIVLCAVVMAAVGLLIFFFPTAILRVYTHDLEVIRVATPALRLVALAAPLIAAALVFTQALFGAGNSRFVMYVEGTLHFFCLALPDMLGHPSVVTLAGVNRGEYLTTDGETDWQLSLGCRGVSCLG